jgi:SagB-type dehydrogenase family enzyme
MLPDTLGSARDNGARRIQESCPSAGALYPMDVYGVIGNNCIEKLNAGVYHYTPAGHALSLVQEGDKRKDVAEASLWQPNLQDISQSKNLRYV